MNPLLGRWISADPLEVHAPGEADANVYAYVRGAVLKSVDPLGLKDKAPGAGGDLSPGAGETVKNPSLDRYGKDQAEVVDEPGGTNPAPGADNSYLGDPTPEINNGIGDPDAAPITDPNDPLNGCLGCNEGDLPQGEGTGLWEDFVGLVGVFGGEDAPRTDGSGDGGGLPMGGNENGTVKGKLVQAVFVVGALWGAARSYAKAAYKSSEKGTRELLDAASDRVDDLRMKALEARDAVVESFQHYTAKERKRVRTVVGGYNFKTGEVRVGTLQCKSADCAEDIAVRSLGGTSKPSSAMDNVDIEMTPAIRPNKRLDEIEVCKGNCQPKYPPHNFAPGTKGQR